MKTNVQHSIPVSLCHEQNKNVECNLHVSSTACKLNKIVHCHYCPNYSASVFFLRLLLPPSLSPALLSHIIMTCSMFFSVASLQKVFLLVTPKQEKQSI